MCEDHESHPILAELAALNPQGLASNEHRRAAVRRDVADELAIEVMRLRRIVAAYKWGYECLQKRMALFGRHEWAHDCDDEIEDRILGTKVA